MKNISTGKIFLGGICAWIVAILLLEFVPAQEGLRDGVTFVVLAAIVLFGTWHFAKSEKKNPWKAGSLSALLFFSIILTTCIIGIIYDGFYWDDAEMLTLGVSSTLFVVGGIGFVIAKHTRK